MGCWFCGGEVKNYGVFGGGLRCVNWCDGLDLVVMPFESDLLFLSYFALRGFVGSFDRFTASHEVVEKVKAAKEKAKAIKEKVVKNFRRGTKLSCFGSNLGCLYPSASFIWSVFTDSFSACPGSVVRFEVATLLCKSKYYSHLPTKQVSVLPSGLKCFSVDICGSAGSAKLVFDFDGVFCTFHCVSGTQSSFKFSFLEPLFFESVFDIWHWLAT